MNLIYLNSKVKSLVAFASNEAFRPALDGVFLDKEKNCAVATNGHNLGKQDINLDKLDKSIMIPTKYLKLKGELFLIVEKDGYKIGQLTDKQRIKAFDMEHLEKEGVEIDFFDSISNVELIDDHYPNYSAVFPSDPTVYRQVFSRYTLEAIVNYMKSRDKGDRVQRVIFEFTKQPKGAVRVLYGLEKDSSGLIMPLRLDNIDQGVIETKDRVKQTA